MKRELLIIAMMVMMQMASGQKVMSVDECMRYAVEHNHGVRQQKLSLESIESDKVAAIGAFMPNVGVSIGAQYNFGRAIDPETNTYTNVNTFYNADEVYASLPVFDGLRRVHALQAEKARVLMGKSALQMEKDRTALAVFQSYADVLYYTGTSEMARAKRDESEMMVKKTRVMEEVGQKSMADVAQMEAQLAGDEYELTKQENMLKVAKIKLNSDMNYEGEIVVEKIKEECRGEEIAAGEAINSEIEEAYNEMEASRLNYAAAKGDYMPQLSVNAGIGTTYYKTVGGEAPSFSEQIKNNKGEYVGASLNIPIFSRMSTITNVKKAKNSYMIAREKYEAKQQELNMLKMQAQADAEGYEKQGVQMEKKVEADSIAYELVRKQYEQGLASPIDVQQSAAALLQSRATELQCRLMLALKRKLYRYYLGEKMTTEK